MLLHPLYQKLIKILLSIQIIRETLTLILKVVLVSGKKNIFLASFLDEQIEVTDHRLACDEGHCWRQAHEGVKISDHAYRKKYGRNANGKLPLLLSEIVNNIVSAGRNYGHP